MKNRQTVYLDFETYYSTEFSLSKVTTREYIMDPRFEVIGVSIAVDDGEARFYAQPDVEIALATFDWPNCNVVCHNTVFDGAILAWKYGVKPHAWFDTMSMGQAVFGALVGGASLAKLSPLVGMKKDSQALLNLRGKRYFDIDKTGAEWERYCVYANDDVNICRKLFKVMKPKYPEKELLVIDTLLRMYIEGQLKIDDLVVHKALTEAKLESAQKLNAAGIANKEQLRSRDKFAQLLKMHGVEPPTKFSPSTGKSTYAFAKNDLEFTKLLEHANPQVVALVEAKLNASSSIEETRAARFTSLSRIGEGVLNVPLRYSAAHTHRFGGCLTSDNYVTVQGRGDVPINRVGRDDLVWDGVGFVAHDGLVFQGIKEVIEHDGVIGTPCHPVLARDGRGYISLAEAKATGSHIRDGAVPDAERLDSSVRRLDYQNDQGTGDLLTVRGRETGEVHRHGGLGAGVVQDMLYEGTHGGGTCTDARDGEGSSNGALAQHSRDTWRDRRRVRGAPKLGTGGIAAVQQSAQYWMEKLRGQGYRVSLRESIGSSNMGREEFGYASQPDSQHRPDRQRRPLRARESAVGDAPATERKPERLSWMAATYDIVSCGPRSRFVANGKIVHNSDKLNLQNLPRKSALREAIVAPPGYKLVVIDASQIEARILAWLAGEAGIRDAFANGEDVYSSFASMVYRTPVNKYDHPDKRFVGKTGILGLGYGTGKDKFQWALLTSPFYDGDAPIDFCETTVNTYRTSYPAIPKLWKRCDELLRVMANGESDEMRGIKFENRRFTLPSGLFVVYPQLHYQDADEWADRGFQYWSHRYKSWKKIYGAALTENIVQSLARLVITDAMCYMRVTDPDYFCALQVHDELVYLVREEKAQKCYDDLMKFMTKIPSWADASLPLAAEGGIGNRYSEVK